MLLAVDVGNTQTVLGVFRDRELAWHWRMSTDPERTADELALLFGGFLEQQGLSFSRQITGVVISSVVPPVTGELREMTRRYFHFDPVVVEPGVKTGVSVLTDNPREVGADRIVNALGAYAKYGGPCIVVDFGTATTYDAVSEKGEYLGGAIAPGIAVAAEGLVAQASRLPRVEIVAPRSIIGKNTVEALQAGLVFGTAAEGGGATVVVTGGMAAVIAPHCHTIDHHEPWLTLEGLRLIFERNTRPDA